MSRIECYIILWVIVFSIFQSAMLIVMKLEMAAAAKSKMHYNDTAALLGYTIFTFFLSSILVTAVYFIAKFFVT